MTNVIDFKRLVSIRLLKSSDAELEKAFGALADELDILLSVDLMKLSARKRTELIKRTARLKLMVAVARPEVKRALEDMELSAPDALTRVLEIIRDMAPDAFEVYLR